MADASAHDELTGTQLMVLLREKGLPEHSARFLIDHRTIERYSTEISRLLGEGRYP